MRILFIGDIFGVPGRRIIENKHEDIKQKNNIDFCIANAENASHGRGMSMSAADTLYGAGVDFITMGNHTWGNGEIFDYIDYYPVIRPANYAEGLPGRGYEIVEGARLKSWKAGGHGVQTFLEVLQNSSNPGFVE